VGRQAEIIPKIHRAGGVFLRAASFVPIADQPGATRDLIKMSRE
jgi:hypothetical protein